MVTDAADNLIVFPLNNLRAPIVDALDQTRSLLVLTSGDSKGYVTVLTDAGQVGTVTSVWLRRLVKRIE